jgi:hypothetical protein
MSRWAVRTNAYSSTIKIGYLSWLFVMAGVVAILRASGRGRCGWEPATLLLMACVPTVWMPLEQFFHPCDLVAMGLILCGVACVLRGWWGWAGVLLALAFTSQQFALLVLVPLVVVVPANRRARFVGMVAITAAIEVLPLVAMTSGRVLRAVVLGSGNPPSMGGTVLWEIHLNGAPLVIASRVLPIALSGTLAWWAVRRVGPHVLEAMPLLSLIATSLAFRLVFEVNLWGYYFMPITLALLMIDVIRGRIRVLLVAWLALVSLVFDPPPWVGNTVNHVLPIWLWQIILVPFVVALAVGPLLSAHGPALMRCPAGRLIPDSAVVFHVYQGE